MFSVTITFQDESDVIITYDEINAMNHPSHALFAMKEAIRDLLERGLSAKHYIETVQSPKAFEVWCLQQEEKLAKQIKPLV